MGDASDFILHTRTSHLHLLITEVFDSWFACLYIRELMVLQRKTHNSSRKANISSPLPTFSPLPKVPVTSGFSQFKQVNKFCLNGEDTQPSEVATRERRHQERAERTEMPDRPPRSWPPAARWCSCRWSCRRRRRSACSCLQTEVKDDAGRRCSH